jgi:biotin carboxyl carrier protein
MANIFNQEALEALDDHSEAKEIARVASPQLKIVLGAMVAMMVVVVYWCIFGTINYKVKAQGVVFPFGEASSVSVPYDGSVSRVLVNHGATVRKGTAVMEIRNALSTTSVVAPRDGVVIQTLSLGTQFKAGEPVAWLLPQEQQMAGREMLCYVTYNDVNRDDPRQLRIGQQVQVTPANMVREDWGYAYGKVVGIEQYPTTRQEIISRVKLDPLAAFIPDGQAMYEVRVVLDEQDGHLVWSRDKSRDVRVDNGALCNIQVITQKLPVWRVLVGLVDNTIESIAGN